MTGYRTRQPRPPDSPDRFFDMFRGVTRSLHTTHSVLLLLQQTCEHLVQKGRYAFAWIGTPDYDGSHRLKPRIWSGSAAGYLDGIDCICQLPSDERDPAVEAYCSGEPVVKTDLDARQTSSEESSARTLYGLAAGVGLPLKSDGRLHGAIGVYSDNRTSFDKAPLGLLSELAEAVAFGMSRFRLQQELDGLRYLLVDHSQNAGRLPVQIGDTIMLLDPDEIYYAQADGHYTRLRGEEKEFFCSHPLKWVVDQLPAKRFLRVHRSFLVNLRHVRALQTSDRRTWLSFPKSTCGPVPVSRGHTSSLRRALGVDPVPTMNV